MKSKTLAIAISSALLLGACAIAPTGPSVMVLPGSGKTFDQFRLDESDCRQYASTQTGTSAEQAQSDSGIRSAAIGAAVGAVAGAAIGGSRSAGVGAGTGLILGSAAGSGAAQGSVRTVQQRYDIAYQQCMYAKGHQVPLAGRFETQRPARQAAHATSNPPPPAYGAPPPPPYGAPPPPPVR